MLDISKQEVKFDCPECGVSNTVTLKQVADEETVKCSGCGKNINLTDKDGSTKKAISSVEKSFEDLENTIKKLGNR